MRASFPPLGTEAADSKSAAAAGATAPLTATRQQQPMPATAQCNSHPTLQAAARSMKTAATALHSVRQCWPQAEPSRSACPCDAECPSLCWHCHPHLLSPCRDLSGVLFDYHVLEKLYTGYASKGTELPRTPAPCGEKLCTLQLQQKSLRWIFTEQVAYRNSVRGKGPKML